MLIRHIVRINIYWAL